MTPVMPAGGDLIYDFTKGKRPTTLPEIIKDRYTATVIDLLPFDVDIARSLMVCPASVPNHVHAPC